MWRPKGDLVHGREAVLTVLAVGMVPLVTRAQPVAKPGVDEVIE